MLCGNYILSNRSEWTFYFLSSVQFNFTIGEIDVLKNNLSLQHELNKKYTPNKEEISRLSHRICNNVENKYELWTDPERIAKQFLMEKYNALVVNQYLHRYRKNKNSIPKG